MQWFIAEFRLPLALGFVAVVCALGSNRDVTVIGAVLGLVAAALFYLKAGDENLRREWEDYSNRIRGVLGKGPENRDGDTPGGEN